MKKLSLIIPILLLTSCKKYPFSFEDKYYNEKEKGLYEITDINIIKNLEIEKESFGVYIYLPGCLTCTKFKPILNEFLNNNNMLLYSISYINVKKQENTLYSNIEYAPSVALFNKGKLVAYLDALKDEHTTYYESLDGFTTWFTTYVEIKK